MYYVILYFDDNFPRHTPKERSALPIGVELSSFGYEYLYFLIKLANLTAYVLVNN